MTELATSTKLSFADSYDDFDDAWEHVEAAVKEFARKHPGCRIKVDDSMGFVLAIFVSSDRP